MEKLTKEQAVQNLKNVCTAYRGTLQEHVVLQESIKLIEDLKYSPPVAAKVTDNKTKAVSP